LEHQAMQKEGKVAHPNKMKTMLSLATAVAANTNQPRERYDNDSQEVNQSNGSPMSKNTSS